MGRALADAYPQARAVFDVFVNLARERRTAVVIVSHDPEAYYFTTTHRNGCGKNYDKWAIHFHSTIEQVAQSMPSGSTGNIKVFGAAAVIMVKIMALVGENN